jgi:hypothetical protein
MAKQNLAMKKLNQKNNSHRFLGTHIFEKIFARILREAVKPKQELLN